MAETGRRDFLKTFLGAGGATLTASVWPDCIRRALAIPARRQYGSIRDVEHIVILMQENRSFDHYFGTLRGVRGFGDRHVVPLRGGRSVWQQTLNEASKPFYPFHLDTHKTSAQRVPDLAHSWADAQDAANQGRWDRWIPAKLDSYGVSEAGAGTRPGASPTLTITQRPGLTMGHYRRADIPFQFTLAEAFTICDAYHCSIYGSTTPNRIMLWSGTNDPSGQGGGPVIDNASGCYVKTPKDVGGNPGCGPRYTFSTYPERLQQAGISWRIYQDPDDNMEGTLNAAVSFAAFAWAAEGSALQRRGMSRWTLEDLKQDVLKNRLPQVSWIVPTARGSEHPFDSSPIQGAAYTSRVLAALTSNPLVWSRTALLVVFDENDGFFDHVPAPGPPLLDSNGLRAGSSTVNADDELHGDKTRSYGLGPRVPMYVVSPWSAGGWVNSELFDHTSIIRFIERRFGVTEPNISAWRRAVCGDLTSAFDFGRAESQVPSIQSATAPAVVESPLPIPEAPRIPQPLFQESGVRPSRALPYEISVSAPESQRPGQLKLVFRNSGSGGAVLLGYDKLHLERLPRRYTIEASKILQDEWALEDDGGAYSLWVYGPNGFVREYTGSLQPAATGSIFPVLTYQPTQKRVELIIRNTRTVPQELRVRANAYGARAWRTLLLREASELQDSWNVEMSGGWYDITLSWQQDETQYSYRFAGRMETGAPSISDPAFGQSL